MDTYFRHRHNTAAQYIATRLIMGIGMAEEHCPVAQVSQRWWDKEVVYRGIWVGEDGRVGNGGEDIGRSGDVGGRGKGGVFSKV